MSSLPSHVPRSPKQGAVTGDVLFVTLPQPVEESREFRSASNGIEQWVLHQPGIAGEAGVGSLLEPLHAGTNVAELRPGGAEAIGHVVVHVWPALDGEDTSARGGVVAGGGFDPCKSGLRTDVRASRSLHGGKRRAGGGHVARIELRQPEIVANDRRVSTACEQRRGLLARACRGNR